MDFKNTETFNFKGAFRGMRNPMNSWDRSDSIFGIIDIDNDDEFTNMCDKWILFENNTVIDYYETLHKYEELLFEKGIMNELGNPGWYDATILGPKDLNLAQTLICAGSEHAKFMRQIFVSVDITAPLYWWKEFDTYKVGTVANSTSTMHKLAAAPITREMFDFDNEDLSVKINTIPHGGETELLFDDYIEDVLDMCENLRQKYNDTHIISYWRALVQLLPSAFLQTRTVTMSYANLRNIYFQRRSHKLKEWHYFCDWIATLPYAKELIMLEDNDEIN